MTDPVERPEAETTAEERARWSAALERDIKSRTGSAMDLFLAMVLRDLARAEARANEATARIAELEACIQHPWFHFPPSPEEADKAWADWVEGVRANLPKGARLAYESSANVVVENFLTEPEAKGGDPAPVPATTEKTDG